MTDRYIVDAELIAVQDTKTGLYAGSMFIEFAHELAKELNNPDNSLFEPDVFTWATREVVIADKDAPDFVRGQEEFISVLKLMKATGLGIPRYAESILANWDAQQAGTSTTFEVAS